MLVLDVQERAFTDITVTVLGVLEYLEKVNYLSLTKGSFALVI